jgi:hypothetical protein
VESSLPDLSPCDYFLWVYFEWWRIVSNAHTWGTDAMENINVEQSLEAVRNIADRIQMVVQEEHVNIANVFAWEEISWLRTLFWYNFRQCKYSSSESITILKWDVVLFESPYKSQ